MSDVNEPGWFEPTGMTACIETTATALSRQIRLIDLEGRELVSAGIGTGDTETVPIQVGGSVVARLELRPSLLPGDFREPVTNAVKTVQALAEAQNTIADLVKTTARQWSELTIVYRSNELFRGDQSPEELARNLIEQAERGLPGTSGAVRYRVGERVGELSSVGDTSPRLRKAAEWGQDAAEAVLFASREEIVHHEYPEDPPDLPFLVVPLRSRNRSFGALVLAADEGTNLSAEDLKLATVLAGQAGQALSNLDMIERAQASERLQRDLDVASEIQTSMHPSEHIVLDWLVVAGHCTPAAEVGGDAYLLVPQSADTLLTGVADVSGHGVSSALLMNSVVSLITALAGQVDRPTRLLEIANTHVCDRAGNTGMFVTAVLMQLRKDGEILIANAGHPPPLIVTPEGYVDVIHQAGFPLGIDSSEVFPGEIAKLPPGGVLVAYSDGVTEAARPDGELFGQRRLEELLKTVVPEARTCDQIRDRILHEIEAFSGGLDRRDDLTLVVLRRTT